VSAWFKHWFGEAYLAIYPHRDEAEAERVVALLAARGIGEPGQRILDLACGPGRHERALARRGAWVLGYDLSSALLRRAREAGARRLVRGDMRALALRGGGFDAVVNLFTSFGYFEEDSESARVLVEVARVLRPGGRIVLDYLNAPAVRGDLVPRDERVVEGRTVIQERTLSTDGRFVVKRIRVAGEAMEFVEQVRLFERKDLEAMLAAAGLVVREALGDYHGAPYDARSPRLILVADRS
jgi:SAM-dependent methyltransferase